MHGLSWDETSVCVWSVKRRCVYRERRRQRRKEEREWRERERERERGPFSWTGMNEMLLNIHFYSQPTASAE